MPSRVRGSSELAAQRGRLIDAALQVLAEHGPAELTVRRVAEVAGASTMGIYSSFGGRLGMLEAVYVRGFELMRDVLHREPELDVLGIALAYREFALDNPALYSLLIERPLADFDPSPQLRQAALDSTFPLLVAAVTRETTLDDPFRAAYLLWTAIHGMVSIELTHALRSPLPGWFLDSRDEGERVLVDGVRAMLHGLTISAVRAPPEHGQDG